MDILTVIFALATVAAAIVAAALYGKWRAADSEAAALRSRIDDMRRDEDRFKALAAEALQNNSADLIARNSADLSALLQPLRDNIGRFERNFTECYSREARERFSLDERIRTLSEVSRNVGEETRRLSEAMKGNNKVQGDWGEMVLESLLTRAGLREGQEFTTQESVTDSYGRRLRPDVVVWLPDDRCIVVDSKVSLKSYFALRDATGPEEELAARKALLSSVKNHIAELRGKNYQDVVGRRQIDLVLMFIPHEGAYLSAIEADSSLCEMAFESRVLVVSPTHLMAVLSLVEQLWRHESQERNAAEIAAQAGRMLDKFEGFLADMERIDRSLKATRDAYENARNKLSDGKGNLISRAESLRQLGARSHKASIN